MKKKIFLSLLVIIVFIISGCGKGVKETDEKMGKERNVYTCSKLGIEDSSSSSKTKWNEDIIYVAKLDNDGKLNYFSTKYVYNYNSQDDCNYWCDIKVKWNDEINAKNYRGGHRETKCSCNNKQLVEEYIYDDIPNLAGILRSDIRELNKDNTFNLDKWLEGREKYGYNCN